MPAIEEQPAAVTTEPAAAPPATDHSLRTGLIYGLLTYAWWGVSPAYFKLVQGVPPAVILCHRILWSVVLLGIIVAVRRQWSEAWALLRDASIRWWLVVTSILIAVNWLMFIYAVTSNRVVEASMGYFANPLVMVALAYAFLGERPRKMQWAALGLGAASVIYQAIVHGGLPWLAIALPTIFAVYTVIRKRKPIGPVTGLFVETAILAPVAAIYLWRAHGQEGITPRTFTLLTLAGPVTTIPLLWFIGATKRLKLTTMGFLQYLNPMLQLMMGLLYGETMTKERWIAFSLIWAAVIVFVVDAIRTARRNSVAASA